MLQRKGAVAPGLVLLLVLLLGACSSGGSNSKGAPVPGATLGAPASENGPRPSAGCTATKPAHAGDTRVNVHVGTTNRFYYRHVPRAPQPTTPMPVVVDLHGFAEPAAFHRAVTNLGRYGDTHGFITITPQGTGGQVPLWDTRLRGADVTFIGALLDHVERTLCIDERRVYVAGLSNGATMASTIGCVYADRIAAIAPVAGIDNPKGCTPRRAMPVVAFHGTKDPYVSFEGVAGVRASVPDIVGAWATRNGCSNPPVEERVAADVRRVRYTCPGNADVELYRVDGGGHTWPGSKVLQARPGTFGKTTLAIDATATMWDFFRSHSLP